MQRLLSNTTSVNSVVTPITSPTASPPTRKISQNYLAPVCGKIDKLSSQDMGKFYTYSSVNIGTLDPPSSQNINQYNPHSSQNVGQFDPHSPSLLATTVACELQLRELQLLQKQLQEQVLLEKLPQRSENNQQLRKELYSPQLRHVHRTKVKPHQQLQLQPPKLEPQPLEAAAEVVAVDASRAGSLTRACRFGGIHRQVGGGSAGRTGVGQLDALG